MKHNIFYAKLGIMSIMRSELLCEVVEEIWLYMQVSSTWISHYVIHRIIWQVFHGIKWQTFRGINCQADNRLWWHQA